jgi:type IV secretion system protein VirB9
MRRIRAVLFGCTLLSVALPAVAFADQVPVSGPYDARMRYVAYNPGQVVHLSTLVGATMVVEFGPTEAVTSVAETDTLHLAAVPKGNFLFLKPSTPLSLQPIIVLTQRQDGSLRRYVFEFETVDLTDPGAASASDDVFYSVQFTYPDDEAAAYAAARAAAAARTARLNRIALIKAEHTAATNILNDQEMNPFIGPRNYKYTAQGDSSLAPSAIWDNGYSTVLQFPGNTRLPSVFVIDPDGKEATATYSVTGSTIQIDQTAKELRLRDGDTVLNVYNLAYNAAGTNPGTGTTSSLVRRLVTDPTDTTDDSGATSP